MAPVMTSGVGVAPQIIDDVKLRTLRERLGSFETTTDFLPQDEDGFLETLATCQTWTFEEQVDLYEWIRPLNLVDAVLSKILRENARSLLLVEPLVRKKRSQRNEAVASTSGQQHAESIEDVCSVPESAAANLVTILRFLSSLLSNCTNKSIFNSAEDLVDLLGAADDELADLALHTLSSLASPPALHKQQSPDMQQHSTALHRIRNPSCHARLLALARGWGSRGSGVGLLACVATDDSEYGQGALPKECGELVFEYYGQTGLVKLQLNASEMVQVDSSNRTNEEGMDVEEHDESKQKRRRMGSITGRAPEKQVPSTSELFFSCLEQAGGRIRIPEDRQFALLADIRLAQAFHSRATRVRAVERRLLALTANLYTHPSQEIMSGYFQAQPELCAELIDLLRPTVSSAAVSAASAVGASDEGDLHAMSALANSPQVPYKVRTLALRNLTALVSRRDVGTSGGLTGVARLTNVLIELGVGKGMHLGMLPTLIRYSLASLNAFLSSRDKQSTPEARIPDTSEAIAMDIGKAFVKAAKPPPLPVAEQLHRALAFIDTVLTLTSAVIATPSGTAALTECGLVPALLSTVSIDISSAMIAGFTSLKLDDFSQARSMIRFIISQAVQIVEGAVVTHNNALSAFHELRGVEVLVSRLDKDMQEIRSSSGCSVGHPQAPDDSAMDIEPAEAGPTRQDTSMDGSRTQSRELCSSQRILLFSLVNGLTVVFHQESSSSTAPASPGGAQLRNSELTGTLFEILRNVDSYGGTLAALASSMLSDVMNNDPQVVHYVHESGLAKAFLDMVMGEWRESGEFNNAGFPASPELIMAIPNVFAALALTENGATAIEKANPFPAFLSIFYSSRFSMPESRCLLNEMTAIVGTGLDEIMRHCPKLRPVVLTALLQAINQVADIGERLLLREEEIVVPPKGEDASELENERSALVQYVLNVAQMLEQILHNADHCEPFAKMGGLQATLRLFPLVMPTNVSFLAHVSCLSCNSTCTLAHSTTEDSLLVVIKSMGLHCDSTMLLKKMSAALKVQLRELKEAQTSVRVSFPASSPIGDHHGASADGILEGLPRAPFHTMADDASFMSKAHIISKYFRQVVILQWYTATLSSVIRAALSRSLETGSDWGRSAWRWKNELTSIDFRDLFTELSLFHQSALHEACRIRTEAGYEERERNRLGRRVETGSVRYRLRIVCQEGAVVRDGIEIDSCASIGSAEFGEIVEAIDRCHNSSGVLRYRTYAGWISELTRGHGREPIAEVLNVWSGIAADEGGSTTTDMRPERRKNFGVSDISATGASVLARLQNTYCELNSILSRILSHGVKALPAKRLVFEDGSIGQQLASLTSMLSTNILRGLMREPIQTIISRARFDSEAMHSSAGAAVYLGILFDVVQASLVDEKRDRSTMNVLLLLSLINSDRFVDRQVLHAESNCRLGVFDGVQFVFTQCLSNMSNRSMVAASTAESTAREQAPPVQLVPRNVAASLPPTIALLRRLAKTPLAGSNAANTLKRLMDSEVSMLIGSTNGTPPKVVHPLNLARTLYCAIGESALEMWTDRRFKLLPVQLAWPFSNLAGEIIACLDKSAASTSTSAYEGDSHASIWNIFSRTALRTTTRRSEAAESERLESQLEEFEPSEDAISQLSEMGFSRDHALDALEHSGSNVIEVAMEYALSNPPPSPGTVERRRTEREARRRHREAANLEVGEGRESGGIEAAADSGSGSALSHSDPDAISGAVSADARVSGDQISPASDEIGKDGEATQESFDDKFQSHVERCRQLWIDQSPDVIVNLLAGPDNPYTPADAGGDGDMEALTLAMNSVLVELCMKYPDKQARIVSRLLDRLKADVIAVEAGSCSVRSDRERNFASLCHAAVLTSRELPRTRQLVLGKGIVSCLVSCLEDWVTADPRDDTTRTWPVWLTPALLLLGTMAEATVIFDKEGEMDGSEEEELRTVRKEHHTQAALVADTARIVFPAGPSLISGAKELEVQAESSTTDAVVAEGALNKKDSLAGRGVAAQAMSLISVPPLAPLLPAESASRCMDVCLNLLQDGSRQEKSFPPPGTAQALLLLMSRLVRSPELSWKFLRTGGPELILSLPRSCRFNGSSGLVAMLLRRVLEDPTTLQTAMETEIRSIVSRLDEHRNVTDGDESASVSLAAFARALKPLISRDPVVFLKAASVTVRFHTWTDKRTSVVLLASKERAARRTYLLERIPTSSKGKDDQVRDTSSNHTPTISFARSKALKGKHNRRGPTSKRGGTSKKNKVEQAETAAKRSALCETPPSQIIAVLMSKAVSLCRSDDEAVLEKVDEESDLFGNQTSFLWMESILEVISDIVLAFPACAAAIHRSRPALSKSMVMHALSGCPSPPRTFVNLLLHRLLPQDRQAFKKDPMEGSIESNQTKTRRKETLIRTRVAQTSARLLVSLVSRSGESRRRVLTDVVFALSGGHHSFEDLVLPSPSPASNIALDAELNALHAWGDLCIGFAAPRSNGSSYDSNGCLSFEMIKVMLDLGMGHALVYALHGVDLQHPRAAVTCASLLVPFEVFTRSAVTEAAQSIATKELEERTNRSRELERVAEPKSKIGKRGEAEDLSHLEPPAFVEDPILEDPILEDGFDAESAARSALGYEVGPDHPSNEFVGEDDHDGQDEEDVEMDEADEDEIERSSNEDISSDEEDVGDGVHIQGSQDDSEEEDTEGEESESDVSGVEDEEEDDIDMQDQDELHWTAEEFFDSSSGNVDAEAAPLQGDPDLDEGWTRVESGGSGLLVDFSTRSAGLPGDPDLSARTRGFIDAAEAMIGNLLRTGDIQDDAIAELEGSLGIRVGSRNGPGNERLMFARRPVGGPPPPPSGWESSRRSRGSVSRGREDVNLSVIPSIHQRSPPEATFFNGGRWNESSTEHVYGGIAAGNRNFDVVTPLSTDNDDDLVYPSIATQLFPGGPAASTHSRTQLTPHPLLTGVELPAINSLVSDLRPHGERATQRDLTGGLRRGELYSSYYPHLGPSSSGRSGAGGGQLGWTDDGLPPDETLHSFNIAFERALAEYRPDPTGPSSDQPVDVVTGADQAAMDDPPIERNEHVPQGETNLANLAESHDGSGSHADAPAAALADTLANNDEPMEEADHEEDDPNPASDGAHVASSLAVGLRLSPQGESVSHTHIGIENNSTVTQDLDGSSEGAMQAQERGSAERIVETQGQGSDFSASDLPPVDPATGNRPETESLTNSDEVDRHRLACPPGMDLEVFNSLPLEMQREVVSQHHTAAEVAAQLDSTSGLDPEALAALPESMRREVIEQEQRERRQREEAPADPANAEEMDNASFLASLAPDLRQEILLTADNTFLNSLPANIIAEAQIIRERASARHRQLSEDPYGGPGGRNGNAQPADQRGSNTSVNTPSRRKMRTGSMKVECDKPEVLYLGSIGKNQLNSPIGYSTVKTLVRFMYLLSPVRPQKLLQKVFQNLSAQHKLRVVILSTIVRLLNDEVDDAVEVLRSVGKQYEAQDWRSMIDKEFVTDGDFPPSSLIGASPEVLDTEGASSTSLFRRRIGGGTATSIAASLPTSSRGSSEQHIPPVAATRMIDLLAFLTKNLPRSCIDALTPSYVTDHHGDVDMVTTLDALLDLLDRPRYKNSSTNLEQLLTVIESVVSPLSNLPRDGEARHLISQKDIDAAVAIGKEWVDVPLVSVSQNRLELLCSILRNENCKDAAFSKVNGIARRLCRVEKNRRCILLELAGVAQILGSDASRDLRALHIRMNDAVRSHHDKLPAAPLNAESGDKPLARSSFLVGGSPSSSVTLSSSSSELKLLRVLQTLHLLCTDHSHEDNTKKNGWTVITPELVSIYHNMDLDNLWSQLTECLKMVKVLEGVASLRDLEQETNGDDDEADDGSDDNTDKKKLQNSVMGLLSRFLPIVEAFLVVNASATREVPAESQPSDKDAPSPGQHKREDSELSSLVNGERVVEFVTANKVLLNALIRNNPGLLEKGLRAMVQVSRCRVLLDFDVKRQWFKTQVRRLRQQASRRHGSLRLVIRREHVFEDAYHMLRLRNADEMRGRLHISFRNEEGVDAGGLSREFFGILAKEIFNPNYALFTSTEDGCTFQPNPNSSINPDHLSYFRFVGRIVGKAVADGYLLDAHFTRSLYKHMLGLKPTHHDMEAIDPDYYKNLKMILEYNLADIGLDLTFSIEDHSFGRSQVIDLIPDGRNIHVTEESKAEYVSLVCQHRMTTAISSQIKAYLDGFYELVSKELIAIFTPRELELLISGLPDIDVMDLKQHTDYHGYKANDKEIQWFWDIMFNLSRGEKASFLQFVTGSSKVPLSGFSELQGMRGVQKFSIHKVGGQNGSLMSAHTCFNSLDLPVYKSIEEMKEKFLYAISEGSGAFLFA